MGTKAIQVLGLPVIIALVALLGLALAGCPKVETPEATPSAPGPSEATKAPASEPAASPAPAAMERPDWSLLAQNFRLNTPVKEQTYYFIGVSVGNPYWVDARIGFQERGNQLGIKPVFTGPVDSNVQGQATELDQVVAQKPSGILIAPADADSLKPGIDRAIDAGIPVITVDTDSPKSKRLCYVGTANYESGLVVGTLMAKALDGKGKVGISNLSGQWNLEERERGVKDALKAYPGIQYVQTVNDRADDQIAVTRNREMISANPDLAGICGLNAASGPGIAKAVIESGKKGQIKIVCFDRNEDMLNYVKDGTIEASVAQKTHLMAALSLQMLYDLNNGKIGHLPDWRQAQAPPLPASVDTGIMVITKENVEQFRHGEKAGSQK
jgi:ribose transport system substrate-binding protein